MLIGTPLNRVLRRIRDTREHHYHMFRGFFRGVTDGRDDEEHALHPRLHSVMVTKGAAAIGQSLAALDLAQLAVEITAIRRRNVRTVEPGPDAVIEENDIVVLLGTEDAVAAAEIKLLQGP